MPAMDPDRIESVTTGPEVELRERGSRFLGQALTCEDESRLRAGLDRIVDRHPDATHHCWAARLGSPGGCVERSDDAGEPAGTAGAPILGALQREDLYGVLVVVTRYYGGTKLGRGGLVRAYGECARQAVAAAPRRVLWRQATVAVVCDYDEVGAVEAVLARAGERVLGVERDFADRARLRIRARQSAVPELVTELEDATRGRASVREEEQEP